MTKNCHSTNQDPKEIRIINTNSDYKVIEFPYFWQLGSANRALQPVHVISHSSIYTGPNGKQVFVNTSFMDRKNIAYLKRFDPSINLEETKLPFTNARKAHYQGISNIRYN